ncbi:hypothetical protein GCM10009839_10110 [Catenulispora yoronensis]|uniref:PKD domain-containing protein n=1 Tax=Catenulispora yoronensis TaxID=450799 RepID=A0ABN2TPC2_9ACTN
MTIAACAAAAISALALPAVVTTASAAAATTAPAEASVVPTVLTATIIVDSPVGSPVGSTVAGTVTASGPNPIVSYQFDFGNGTKVTQSTPDFEVTYVATQTYNIGVLVTDSTGNTFKAVSNSFDVTVPNSLTRLAGDSRYGTSTAVSQRFWASAVGDTTTRRTAHAVVLASGENAHYPDALAGGPLAAYKQGPLLLTETAQLTDTTRQEIHRVLPPGGTVYVLGGEAAISAKAAATLAGDGYTVVRYGGQTRYQTALTIAEQGLDNPNHVVLVTGKDFPDALAAGPAATGLLASDGKPAAILLSDGDTVEDRDTAAYVVAKMNGFGQTTFIVPNVSAIGWSASVAGMKLAGVDPRVIATKQPPTGPNTNLGVYDDVEHDPHNLRSLNVVAGSDRYTTAQAAAAYDRGDNFCCIGNDPFVGYASGATFADALTGGAAMATIHGRLFLTEPTSVPAADTDVVNNLFGAKTHTAFIFGGTAAVSQHVENQLSALLQAPIVK